VQQLFAGMAMVSFAAALVACTERPPAETSATSASSIALERPAPIVRTPLAPAPGYASPPGRGGPPPLGAPYGNSPAPPPLYGTSPDPDADPQTAALDGWRASPRWSAVEGDGCIEVEQTGEPGARGQMKIEPCAKQARRGETPALAPAETMPAPDAMPPGETMAPPDY
jgi:hypothetical protein